MIWLGMWLGIQRLGYLYTEKQSRNKDPSLTLPKVQADLPGDVAELQSREEQQRGEHAGNEAAD